MNEPRRSRQRPRVGVRIAPLALSLLMAATPAVAQETGGIVFKRGDIAEDLYLAAGRVDVLASVDGDVVAAGGRVAIGERVTGDVLAAGGEVVIRGQLLDDVRAAGGMVSVDGDVGGDAVVAGGSVSVSPEAWVRGRAWLAGGDIDVRGRIGRSLRAAGGTIRIAGAIDGDADLVARRIELLPTARIRGHLTYRSPQEATIAPSAEIDGGTTRVPAAWPDVDPATGRLIGWIAGGVGAGALVVAGVVLSLLFPGFTTSAARTIGRHPWKSLGVGFALLVTTPAAAAVLLATLLGSLLGGSLLMLYAISLLVGLLVGATFLGGLMTRLGRREPSAGRTVLSVVLGLIVLGLLQVVPVAGVALLLLFLILGHGALGIHGYRRYAAGRQ